jgi:hypothetical protein
MTDIAQELKQDVLKSNDVVTMVDVDYHVDDFAKWRGHVMLVYTSIPTSLGGTTNNGVYYFTDTKTMVEEVDGGAVYVSGVWDFGHDYVIIEGAWGFTIYTVDMILQPKTANRHLVLLNPKVDVYVPYGIFKWWMKLIGGNVNNIKPLTRMQNVIQTGDMLVGKFVRKRERVVSIKHVGAAHPFCVNLPIELWESLITQKKHSKTFTISDIERICDHASKNCILSKTLTHVHYAYIIEALGVEDPFPKCVCFQAYGGKQMLDFEDGKVVAELAAEPIVTSTAVVATQSVNNERLCVTERVTNIRNTVKPPDKYIKFKEEFVKLLVPIPGLGSPVDIQEVLDNQSSKVQRARQDKERSHVRRKNVCSAFVKVEATEKIDPGHNISGMRQDHCLNLSRFAYGLKQQVLKKLDCYMPSSAPGEIVRKVRKYCLAVLADNKAKIAETDYKRFDASMSAFLREVEHEVYNCWISPKYAIELAKLLEGEINLNCYSKFGTQYKQKSSRCSGSPLTTEGNTIINMFVAYCAYRTAGFSPEKAFKLVGPKYGDDGIDSSRGNFDEVSKDLGLVVKLKLPGRQVSFLGRVFVDVKAYNTTYSNPKKLLQRVGVVTRMDPDALKDRVNGYMVTEGHVPLVGNYLRALQRIYKLGQSSVSHTTEHDMAWRLRGGPYPVDESDLCKQVLRDAISKDMNLTGSELDEISRCLDKATVIADLEKLKIFTSAPVAPTFKCVWVPKGGGGLPQKVTAKIK